MRVGRHVVRHWSSTQATLALSSGEAEYAALVKTASCGLGLQSMMLDLGIAAQVKLECDSAAAIGIASRVGLGKLRHLEVHLLWLQELVRDKRVQLHKVDGKSNISDFLTKFCKKEVLDFALPACCFRERAGRAEVAPEMQG